MCVPEDGRNVRVSVCVRCSGRAIASGFVAVDGSDCRGEPEGSSGICVNVSHSNFVETQ